MPDESPRARFTLRREEWALSFLLVASAIACFTTRTGFSLRQVGDVVQQYMSYFGLYYMLVFMATRFWERAGAKGFHVVRYASPNALLSVDYELARGGLWFFLSLGVYTNLKMRIPLLNSLVIDPLLGSMDAPFNPLIMQLAAHADAHPWVDSLLTNIYLNDFLFVAGAVVLLHVRGDALGMRMLLLGSALLFLLGVWVTVLIPSYGPFAVRPDVWRWVRGHQMGMFQGTLLKGFAEAVQMLDAPKPLVARAGAGVAAFPSLHVAQLALVALICRVREKLRWFAVLTVLGTLGTMLATLAYGWHYVSDALGGVALAGVTFVLVTKLIGVAKTDAPAA